MLQVLLHRELLLHHTRRGAAAAATAAAAVAAGAGALHLQAGGEGALEAAHLLLAPLLLQGLLKLAKLGADVLGDLVVLFIWVGGVGRESVCVGGECQRGGWGVRGTVGFGVSPGV